jgi:hypothetical protein
MTWTLRGAVAGLVAASLSGLTAGMAWGEPPDTPPLTAPKAAMKALFDVCREAAVQNTTPEVFATRLGYAREPAPQGLPMAREGALSWRVPSSTGEVHVLSGAIPEPAQASACLVAIYGDPATDFETTLTARLAAPDVGFERDDKQSFTTDRFQVTHYDSSQGYLVRNVMVVRPLTTSPDHPTLSIITYRVDYSWLRSISH